MRLSDLYESDDEEWVFAFPYSDCYEIEWATVDSKEIAEDSVKSHLDSGWNAVAMPKSKVPPKIRARLDRLRSMRPIRIAQKVSPEEWLSWALFFNLKDKNAVLKHLKKLAGRSADKQEAKLLMDALKIVFPMHFAWFEHQVKKSDLKESSTGPWFVESLWPLGYEVTYFKCGSHREADLQSREDILYMRIVNEVPMEVWTWFRDMNKSQRTNTIFPSEWLRMFLRIPDLKDKDLVLESLIDVYRRLKFSPSKTRVKREFLLDTVKKVFPMHFAWFERELRVHQLLDSNTGGK